MNPQLFLITGVNGVGKSSVIPELRSLLNVDIFEIHDFDERGVPDNAGQEWRESETKYWVKSAEENGTRNISTVVCGFMKTGDIQHALSDRPEIRVNVCLLDASPETISKRILSRYTTPGSLQELERMTGKTPEKFVSDNVWVSTKFRKEAEENGYYVLDTNNLTPKEVAEKIVAWVNMREYA